MVEQNYTPDRTCKRCNEKFPATGEYFYFGSRGKLFSKCKPCVSEETRLRKIQKNPEEHLKKQEKREAKLSLEIDGFRVCCRCGEKKPATSKNFTKNKALRLGITSLCRECSRKEQKKARNTGKVEAALREADDLFADGKKRCERCKEVTDVSMFGKNKKRRDGLNGYCKSCVSQLNSKFRAENLDALKARSAEWRAKNKDAVLLRAKKYRTENRDAVLASLKKYYWKNRDSILESAKAYRQANKETLQAKKRVYRKTRAALDPVYAMSVRIYGLISVSIRNGGYTKKSSTLNILGCSYEEFKRHIERQFLPRMNWDNRSEWHIDHIIPIATAKTEEDVIRLNHFTNLRPLWAKDNIAKGAKVEVLI